LVGKGSQQGGFIPGIDHNGKWHQLVEVWTNGYVEIQFQYMKKSPPFDQAASRDELRKRLNALDGVSLDDDTIDRRPGNDQQASIARDLAQALGAKKPLAVFDLETTGTYVRSDRIVEIAILRIDVDGTATYKVRTFNPEMPIPADATAVHGISDEDVAAEPTFRQVARSLAEFLEGCDLRGFNL